MPKGQSQESLFTQGPELFNPDETKQTFKVDAYFVQLNLDDPEYLVEYSTYWYSLWSHRRTGLWKGFIRVDLDPADDAAALANLNNSTTG